MCTPLLQWVDEAGKLDEDDQQIQGLIWELLLHQTFAPAIEVFKAGTQRFPELTPLHNGLGIVFYSAGQTDDAVGTFSGRPI